ncbi:SMI1/KNR4 family protein [Actinosynnema sp. NPDC020468]|uniref:SMI1/KNR4 family protein n=1 Tax=Actinosynnema sp. NPDC020468 TaxID=3154488 RepID=UPI0033EA29F0
MSAPVEESWDRIEKWLHATAPAAAERLSPPASAAAVGAAETTVGLPFPPDLVASLRRHDGVTPYGRDRFLLPPHWILVSLEYCVETWRRYTDELNHRQATEIESMDGEDEDAWSEPEEDEDAFWGWSPGWFPIAADGTGCHLLVELRPGPRYGAVGSLVPDTGPSFEGFGTWSSVAALLADTAAALAGDSPQWTVEFTEHGPGWAW